MTALTPDMAHDWPCPIARLKPFEKVLPNCEGPFCILWRWQPLTVEDNNFKAHVAAKMKELGGAGHHKAAVAWVMENREALGIPTKPTHGFCGLGGRPEA